MGNKFTASKYFRLLVLKRFKNNCCKILVKLALEYDMINKSIFHFLNKRTTKQDLGLFPSVIVHLISEFFHLSAKRLNFIFLYWINIFSHHSSKLKGLVVDCYKSIFNPFCIVVYFHNLRDYLVGKKVV